MNALFSVDDVVKLQEQGIISRQEARELLGISKVTPLFTDEAVPKVVVSGAGESTA